MTHSLTQRSPPPRIRRMVTWRPAGCPARCAWILDRPRKRSRTAGSPGSHLQRRSRAQCRCSPARRPPSAALPGPGSRRHDPLSCSPRSHWRQESHGRAAQIPPDRGSAALLGLAGRVSLHTGLVRAHNSSVAMTGALRAWYSDHGRAMDVPDRGPGQQSASLSTRPREPAIVRPARQIPDLRLGTRPGSTS